VRRHRFRSSGDIEPRRRDVVRGGDRRSPGVRRQLFQRDAHYASSLRGLNAKMRDETRSTVTLHPDVDRWMARGREMPRDAIVAFARRERLHQLSVPDPVVPGTRNEDRRHDPEAAYRSRAAVGSRSGGRRYDERRRRKDELPSRCTEHPGSRPHR
jgi:hypothetical protein